MTMTTTEVVERLIRAAEEHRILLYLVRDELRISARPGAPADLVDMLHHFSDEITAVLVSQRPAGKPW